ncbi:aldose epimerase family protein [Agaribacter marinus]|uniref:Aldose 1-epimerase n=1 Tax=Agaribacter marinus TaxID=1431249 RepID=A0AA37T1D8_9ALTE|nr:aldose epimerase family protein [Agaribacter marinus]GLR72000.1 aldose 1-epimerase [Agaribacter marinus]
MSTLNKVQLINKHGMTVTLCDFGARILSIQVPSSKGELIETTLNLQNDEEILTDSAYMGAKCGRVANRISNASFKLNGQTFLLEANEPNKTLHGGPKGIGLRTWHTSPVTSGEGYQEVTFNIHSENGDQGFPGNMDISCIFRLNDDNSLTQRFVATSDADCPINICDHTYFTLGAEHLESLSLQVEADEYIPVDDQGIPSGQFLSVEGIMDFRKAKALVKVLPIKDYDECYRLNAAKNKVATLANNTTGLTLTISTDQPGLQVYTGNYLPQKHSAVALEAQGYPDAINQSAFKADIVTPDKPYARYVTYTFSS